MHGFLSLAPVLALALGQAEPAEPSASPPAPPASESAAAAEPAPEAAIVAPPAPRAAPRPAAAAEPAAAPAPPAQPAQPAQAVATVPSGRAAEPERAQVARAALAFLDALLAGDATAVAAACSERFSFDGDVRTGKEEVRRAWRALLADRDPDRRGALLDLELLTAADAVTRLGPPPPRLAPLAGAKGIWVAIANVSRRPVVLFLAREGGRWAIAGIE